MYRLISRELTGTALVRLLPDLPPTPPPLPPLDLVQQLTEELRIKNMLYSKHHLQLTKVIGEGILKVLFLKVKLVRTSRALERIQLPVNLHTPWNF